ncbi:bile acid:sodium symporter family protein [Clostridium ganghwense]|uniref:Bile acid:sodium symporter family protein n=1 Tax=Clostridium ganghwense TaxID=312089 RepID=A0ABT4CJL2_9CLOT|nr:bile acid:sodium symporter family protein [Clostridium ganghwense]MCY6369244.1 bile acid:sodium symporter family protein [Clostridium ganghwense]
MSLLGILKKINKFAGKYFAILVIAVSAWCVYKPLTLKALVPHISLMLGFIMFGMGMSLKSEDLQLIFKRPKEILIGATVQFTVMPLIAFVLCYLFKLPSDLAVGVILVGTCPGGTSSNVMTYLGKGDIALSVSMTTVTTLLAPIVTPFLTLLLAGKFVPVSAFAMFLSIVKIILLPIFLSIIVKKLLGHKVDNFCEIFPLVSIVCIVLISGCIAGANASKITTCALLTFLVIAIHNALGLVVGYFAGKLFGFSEEKRRTLSFEIGIQNSGLGVSLAAAHFNPTAALPAAITSIWQIITGPIIASYWAKKTANNTHDKKFKNVS